MKKLVSVPGAILFALLVFSCSSFLKGTVWDDSIPPERSAKVIFFFYKPKSYNGITVNTRDFRIVTLPAGNATFTGDVVWGQRAGNVQYNFRTKDAVFSCKLEEGKEYWATVYYEYDKDTKRRTWGIYLYNDVIKIRVGYPDDDKLVGFIPFNPPVISN
jgi:hypothetical protein